MGLLFGIQRGLLAFVLLPIIGVSIGTFQFCRGIFNTPEAIYQRYLGKVWNEKERKWIEDFYSLDDEAVQVEQEFLEENQQTEHHNHSHVPSKHVSDRQLYDLLEVEPDASYAQIKKQYYKLAKQYHPDKCHDDPNAKDRFQKLGEQ